MTQPPDATILLRRLAEGDASATGELFPLVQAELRRLAASYMSGQPSGHTLQATALVNEAYLKLVQRDRGSVSDRAHFFRLAASAMRSVLVDHARSRRREKRGGGADRVTLRATLHDGALRDVASQGGGGGVDMVDLDGALSRLQSLDEQLARIVELRFFGGLTSAQIGESLGVTARTVDRGWRVAQGWLRADIERQLGGPDRPSEDLG